MEPPHVGCHDGSGTTISFRRADTPDVLFRGRLKATHGTRHLARDTDGTRRVLIFLSNWEDFFKKLHSDAYCSGEMDRIGYDRTKNRAPASGGAACLGPQEIQGPRLGE
jgi:hypothetical protein